MWYLYLRTRQFYKPGPILLGQRWPLRRANCLLNSDFIKLNSI